MDKRVTVDYLWIPCPSSERSKKLQRLQGRGSVPSCDSIYTQARENKRTIEFDFVFDTTQGDGNCIFAVFSLLSISSGHLEQGYQRFEW